MLAALHVGRAERVRQQLKTDRPATGVRRHRSLPADVQPRGVRGRETAFAAHARTRRTQTGSHTRDQTVEMDDSQPQLTAHVGRLPNGRLAARLPLRHRDSLRRF